jgi:formate hydrogenlyase transcriptional activator
MQNPLKNKHAELEERLKFESLLAETSSCFINLPAEEVDREIKETERRICDLLGLDMAALCQWSNEEPGLFVLTHFYSTEKSSQLPERIAAEDYFPWYQRQMRAGRIIAVSSLDELPEEATRDREVGRQLGIKSNLSIPLSVGGSPPIGVLGLNTIHVKLDWTDTLVNRLKMVAQIFANALARKRTEQNLRQKTEELNHFFEVSLDFLCIANTDGYFLRLNPHWERILGYSRDELTAKPFFTFVHPEDLMVTQTAISSLASQQKLISFQNRYRCKDGTYRWLEWNAALDGNLIFAAARDITRRKLTEQTLKERLKFETILTEISSRFVNVPAGLIDDEITDAQRRICENLDLDLCALWQWSADAPESLLMTHIYRSREEPSLPEHMDAKELFPWSLKQVSSGNIIAVSSMVELPTEAARDVENYRYFGIKSTCVFPLVVGDEAFIGALGFSTVQAEYDWPEEVVKGLKLIAQVFANALSRNRSEKRINKYLDEIEELKQRLEKENIYLQDEIKLITEHMNIVGQSAAIKKVLSQAEQVAQTDSSVLITGETGTGKELLARAVHSMSLRKNRPMVTVNCASLPPTLIESELFGREKGAYTGALTRMIGRFEIADGSTLFLDEIGELPFDLQVKLLRVIEEGSFERIGSTKTLHVNVRIIAATNRDIVQDVKDGKFRRDLFYRINVFPIRIPPLRERAEDIPLIAWAFVRDFQKRMGKNIESISKTDLKALQSNSWPGNVRELRNVIEHAMIVSKGKTLTVRLPKPELSTTDFARSLQDMERKHITAVLEEVGWKISGEAGAADVLGLKRTTLQSKIKKLGIKRIPKTMPK